MRYFNKYLIDESEHHYFTHVHNMCDVSCWVPYAHGISVRYHVYKVSTSSAALSQKSPKK